MDLHSRLTRGFEQEASADVVAMSARRTKSRFLARLAGILRDRQRRAGDGKKVRRGRLGEREPGDGSELELDLFMSPVQSRLLRLTGANPPCPVFEANRMETPGLVVSITSFATFP